MLKRLFTRFMILVVFVALAGCYHAPRTTWTPDQYKKRKQSAMKKAY